MNKKHDMVRNMSREKLKVSSVCHIAIALSISAVVLATSIILAATDRIAERASIKGDLQILSQKIDEMQNRQCHAHNIAESARALGVSEDHAFITMAQDEWWQSEKIKQQCEKELNSIAHTSGSTSNNLPEYPEAEYVWDYFKNLGYSEYVCAGILGNIMAECGGQTLNIEPCAGTADHYGICQWSMVYYPGVVGSGLKEQCEYLQETIKWEFETFGYCYYKGFDYDAFLGMDNERDAALAFAKVYERCASGSYSVRMDNATEAYKMFR